MRALIAFALAATAVHAGAADTLNLNSVQFDGLAALQPGASLVIENFPDGFGGRASLRFERIEIYARDARVVVVDAQGEREVPRSRRVELIGADTSGAVRASLAFDPGFVNVSGVGSSPSGAFAISAASGAGLSVAPVQSLLPPGVVPQTVSGEDSLPSGRAQPTALAIALAGQVPAGGTRTAIVAIDTDNEFMTERFANNTTTAADWIADLFGAMNVMYQRDLNVTLQQGTTYLRTTTDPYTQTGTPANQADLTEFGSYWQSHYGNVPRSFAALLSGKSSSGNSASGIAWVNAYCQTQSQGGSYSVNQIFTNSQVSISYSVLIVGHEIGHNFGAYHTHCTNSSTGSAPTASNTIDKCYSGESYSNGSCYSGTTSCPTSGPGAPAGTVMSYCANIGCGPNATNVLQFHPTQISVLSTLIAQNASSCLAATTDEIFSNGFD